MTKVTAKEAAPLCQRAKVGEAARKLLRDGASPESYLELLTQQQLFHDAIKFLAQALPKREAVWWACQCVKSAIPADPQSKAAAALAAAETWVREPTDENRRAAYATGEAAGLATPAGCTTLGVFLSGGSMGPPNVPEIPPADHLTGEAVAGAIIMAAVAQHPEKSAETLHRFLLRGLDIASGKETVPV
jgi:hypothetical protein